MDLSALEKLPETERLAAITAVVRQVQTDATEVARILLEYEGLEPTELRERWRPIIEEAADEVIEASDVLRKAVRHIKGVGQHGERFSWSAGEPQQGWLHALLRTAGALTGLIVRIQAFEMEGRSVEQFNSMRLRALTKLPAEVRAQITKEAGKD